MKKKLLCWLLAFTILCPASMLRAKSSEEGHPVKVILKDGTIIHGEMLGLDDGTLMLQTSSGKSKEISVSKIKKIFDVDGNVVPMDKSGGEESAKPARHESDESVSESSSSDEEEATPRRRRKSARQRAARSSGGGKGAKIAGIVLDVVGGVGFIGGLWLDVDGQNTMDTATSRYCPATVCTDGYYPYRISGKPGYYTSTQYSNYYYGQTERDTGVVVMVVGGALLITGIILGAVGSSRSQAGLMDIQDNKIAFDVPRMDYNPNTQQSRVTLLSAQF